MHSDIERAKKNILKAQQYQVSYANRSRRLADGYVVGDRVMLSTDKLVRGGKKLACKWIGPFTVSSVLPDMVVELELPATMKLRHSRFNISKVKMFKTAEMEFPGRQQQDRPVPEMVDGQEEYEVEKVLAKEYKKEGRRIVTWYLIKWKGYDVSECTWQRLERLENAKAAIEAFETVQEE
jgi:hypothetical protein